MKKRLICILLVFSISLTGCFSYTDINKVLFVTSIIIDVDSSGDVILYLEAFKPFRSASKDSSKGQKITFKDKGKTIFEVMRDADLYSSYKLNYTQNKAIIFTQRAAEFGIENFIDAFTRDQELLIRSYVAVFVGNPENLLTAQIKDEDYVGVFLHDLIDNQINSARTVQVQINEFGVKRLCGDKANVVTTIRMAKDQPETKIEVDGGAIIKNDKLVGFLPKQDGEKYNFLMNNVKTGTLEPANPMYKEKFITLEIEDSKTRTYLTYDGKKVHLKKSIKTKATIADVQKAFITSKNERDKLARNAEENITNFCTDLFNEYKKNNVDIFEIQDEFERKYPRENIKNVIGITDLEVDSQVTIDDSMNKQETK